MPLSGVNVNNPQNQLTTITPTLGGISQTYGGNVLGSGSSSTSGGGDDFSTILLYGAIALLVIWILKKIES